MNSGALGWCAPAVQQVQRGEQGVAQQHARTGVAHHLAHPLAHFGLVTVDGAFGAGGLAPAEGALLDAQQRVRLQFGAGGAKPANGLVVRAAVHADHHGYGAALAREARFNTVHEVDSTINEDGEREGSGQCIPESCVR